jgi:transposase
VTGEGRPLPPRLAQEIKREIDRLGLVQDQIAAIEQERDESPTSCKETENKRGQLLLLKGIGPTGSAVMAREVYYRQFSNRRQIAGFSEISYEPL